MLITIIYMKFNSDIGRSKRNMKSRPITIHRQQREIIGQNVNLYNYHKSQSQGSKKHIKESPYVNINKQSIKHNYIVLKPYSEIEQLNRTEIFNDFEILRNSIESNARVQPQIFKKPQNKPTTKSKVLNKFEPLLPLIIQRAPIQTLSKIKQGTRKNPNNNFPGLPRTRLYIPYLANAPSFITNSPLEERTHENLSNTTLQELSKESIYKGTRRLVYDIYEVSPFTNNESDYEHFLIYSSDMINIDATWECYPLICIGKGGPKKYFHNKSYYKEELIPYYIPQTIDDITLMFESRFESGNLRRAVQM